MNEKSILDLIRNSKGYDVALFTTFNFDVSFFETFIKNALFSNRIKEIYLFVDSKELNKAITKSRDVMNMGHHYDVSPIELNAAFHPKIVLLLGERKARLFVSSCNLKPSGYTINNEAFGYYDFDVDKGENKETIISAINFFIKLNSLSFRPMENLSAHAIRYRQIYEKIESNNEGSLFLHNLDTPLLSQVKERIKIAERINIAVPYYDNFCLALKEISGSYSNAEIKLFLQNKKARIPEREASSIFNISIYPFAGFKDRKNNNFYHGKVINLVNELGSYILFGSANCTASALLKTYKDGGNIEADIFLKTSEIESGEYFDNFRKFDGEKPEYDLMKYDDDVSGNYFFRYGIIQNKQLHLYIGFKRKNDSIIITLDNEECMYSYCDNNIDVVIDLKSFIYKETLVLKIQYSDIVEDLVCWYVFPEQLLFTRQGTFPKYNLDNVTYDPNNGKYAEIVREIIKALALTPDEYMNYENMQRLSSVRESINNEDDEFVDKDYEDDEDGVIDYDIPILEYDYQEKLVKKINEIKTYNYNSFFRYLYGADSGIFGKSEVIHKNETTNVRENNTRSRRPTSEEKSLKNFLNRRIKGFVSEDYVNAVSFEHFISSSAFLFIVFENFSITNRIVGLFNDGQTAFNRLAIVERLIELLPDSDKKKKDEVIYLTARVILTNKYYVEVNTKTENEIKVQTIKLLKRFEAKVGFRERISEMAVIIAEKEFYLNANNVISYIDDEIYGCLPINRIIGIAQTEFKNKFTQITIPSNAPVVSLEVVTDDLSRFYSYDYACSQTLKELYRYARCQGRSGKVAIVFSLSEEKLDYENLKQVISITYEYDSAWHYIRIIDETMDGSKKQHREDIWL